MPPIWETLEQLLWLFCPLKLKKVKFKPFGVLFSIDMVEIKTNLFTETMML